MNTELESSLIKGELDTLIDDYNNTANSSTEDDFAELNQTYLDKLYELEIKITNKYTEKTKFEYEEQYYPILYNIQKEKEKIRIQTTLNKLIDDYNNTADSSSYDDFAKLNKTYLENLQKLKTEITNKYTGDDFAKLNQTYLDNLEKLKTKITDKYNTYPDDKKSDYYVNYFDTLSKIEKEQYPIIFKNTNDKLERLDKDYNESLDNDIKQNLKNIGLNILFIFGCIVLIILIDNSISDWIFGILLFGNCLMLVINSVKYFNNKFYKSQLDKRKKATGKGEGDGKIMREFINKHNMINANPVFNKFRHNVRQRFDYENENANNIKTN